MPSNFRLLMLVMTLGLCPLAQANVNFCPDLSEIKRTPGEYSWATTRPGWEGQFIAPLHAKGYSTEISSFAEARWIAFSNLPTTAGYIQCDYNGNLNEEVIRFSQIGSRATHQPTGINWVAQTPMTFPNVQATCTSTPRDCSFWEEL